MIDLDELASRIEIEHVLVRYCRGVDRGDAQILASVYHPDAIDEHGPFRGLGTELAKLLGFTDDEPTAGGHHHLHNVYIEFDGGDDARVESYVMAYHPRRHEAGHDELLVFAGRYLDRFQRRDGEWKIANRRVVSDWHRVDPLDPPMDGYPVGHKGPPGADLSYELFPRVHGGTP